MNTHFRCTQCANCCHHTKIPVTVAEAIAWLDASHPVQVICVASPWMPPDELQADSLRRRSFASHSGSMPLRISVTLVANLTGQCPNLLADLRCGIYERRPLVCRIYPAEANPFTTFDPAKKACPTEAWVPENPLFLRETRPTSQTLADDIQRWRDSTERDVGAKRWLCAALDLDTAAIDREGFFVHSPPADDLKDALAQVRGETGAAESPLPWRLVSDRDATLHRLTAAGAIAAHPRGVKAGPYEYIGLQS